MKTETLDILLISLAAIIFIVIIVLIAWSERQSNRELRKELNKPLLDSIEREAKYMKNE